jgi:dihydroflavonol-4-reductase
VLRGSSVVFHAAGPVAIWGIDAATMMQGHVRGTAHVLHYAPPQARIIYTSSVTTIGATRKPVPLDEDHTFNLDGLALPYIHAKRAAEQAVLAAGKQGRWACVVNPGYLVGPEDFGPSVMGRFCQRFWKGRIWLVPRGGINVADVRDVARGHLLAAEHGQPGRRYILGGHNVTFWEFCQLLAQVSEMRPRFLGRCPSPILTILALLAHMRAWWSRREPYPSFGHVKIGSYYWYYSSRYAMEELGYSVRSITDTIRDTWEWYSRQCQPKWRAFQKWWLRPAA